MHILKPIQNLYPTQPDHRLVKKYLDAKYYAGQLGLDGGAQIDLAKHYLTNWQTAKAAPHLLFDPQFYLSENRDVREAGANPFLHFLQHGYREGRNPNPLVFTQYLQHNLGLSLHNPRDLFKAVATQQFLNPLMRKKINLTDIFALLDDKSADLSEYFSFGYQKWLSQQQDVIRDYPKHPLLHLFHYGLKENRLTSSGALDRRFLLPLTLTSDRRSDFEIVESSRVAHQSLNYDTMTLPKHNSINVQKQKLAIGIVYFNNNKREIDMMAQSVNLNRNVHGVDVSVFVLDNSPDAKNPTKYQTAFADCLEETYLRPQNLGFARGHNLLMAAAFDAGFDTYLALNPDGFLLDDTVSELLKFATIDSFNSLVELQSVPICHPKWYHPLTGDTHWVSGAAFLMPRKIYEATAGFDPDFPLYGEDVDLSLRVSQNGFGLKVCARAQFYHDVAPRFGKANPERTLNELRGNLYLCQKWGQKDRAIAYLDTLIGLNECPPSAPKATSMHTAPAELAAQFCLPRYGESRFW